MCVYVDTHTYILITILIIANKNIIYVPLVILEISKTFEPNTSTCLHLILIDLLYARKI
jgi:hypothetical protein